MTRFWEEQHGAVAEEFSRDWEPLGPYRGQNSNMHLTEALMAAFEATGDNQYLRMAERIADLIVDRHAARHGWRLPEHFDAGGTSTRDYSGSPMFRPYGTTPGHWLEWARLLLQLWELGGRTHRLAAGGIPRPVPAGGRRGLGQGEGRLLLHARMVRRAAHPRSLLVAVLRGHRRGPCAARGDRRCRVRGLVPPRSGISAPHDFIDRTNGGWHPQLDDALRPNADPFFGKPDIYHALQACLIPLLPATGSITRGLAQGVLSLESETWGTPA